MNTLALIFWVWTNGFGQIESTTIQSHAPPDAAQRSTAPSVTLTPTAQLGPAYVLIPSSPDGTNGFALGVAPDGTPTTAPWYASPERSEAEIRSNLAARAAETRQLRKDLRLVRDALATNKADVQAIVPWTNGVTAAQQRGDFNTLRREMIDTINEVQKLRRALSRSLREDE